MNAKVRERATKGVQDGVPATNNPPRTKIHALAPAEEAQRARLPPNRQTELDRV